MISLFTKSLAEKVLLFTDKWERNKKLRGLSFYFKFFDRPNGLKIDRLEDFFVNS